MVLKCDPSHLEALNLLKRCPPVQPSKAASEIIADDLISRSVQLKDRGNESIRDGKFQEAVALYTESIACDPTNVVAYCNRSQAFLKLSRFADAERDASYVIASAKDISSGSLALKALFRRALALRSMGGTANLSAAVADLEKLLSIEPDNKSASQEHARSRQLLNEASAAQRRAEMRKPSKELSATQTVGGFELKERSTVKRTVPQPSPARQEPTIVPTSPQQATEGASAISGAKSSTNPPKRASPLGSKNPVVPQDPPKNVYEFERNWRALRTRPELFAEYLRCFKRATFGKVFKTAISPELVSSMLSTLRDHADVSLSVAVLTGLAQTSNFSMTRMLLPENDITALEEIFKKLDMHASEADTVEVQRLRKSYEI